MFTRYRNLTLLGVVILAQLLLLAYQVRRPDAGGVRLLRLWTIRAVVPVARATHLGVGDTRNAFHNYVMLRGARQEAASLRAQLQTVELENMQLRAMARQAGQLDALLGFKVGVIERTVPAQVIGGSASPDSQVLYLNRGADAGLLRNMPVLTPQGVVGKITQTFPEAAEVLLITDPDSGLGATLAATHVHGILWGMGPGRTELRFVSDDERVAVGMQVVTSGEDQIFPAGLVLGTVIAAHPDQPFQSITVRPAVDLAQVEDVLVATRIAAEPAEQAVAGLTAAQLHDKGLPSIPHEAYDPPAGAPPMISAFLSARRAAARGAVAGPAPVKPPSPGARLNAGPAQTAPAHPATAAPTAADPASGRLPAGSDPQPNAGGQTRLPGAAAAVHPEQGSAHPPASAKRSKAATPQPKPPAPAIPHE